MRLAAAHHAAREIIRNNTGAKVGWTVTDQAPIPAPGNDNTRGEPLWAGEDLFLEVARDDDFIGVQSCGIVPSSPAPNNTRTGNAYRPDALSIAVRRAWEATGGVPILITEHGIATTDDTQRVTYTSAALRHLFTAIDDGIDVRGYLHRSALDNLERGHGEPTFGLIAVDRDTFARKPKPSLYWLGDVARRGHP